MEPRITRITLSVAEQPRWSVSQLLALLACVLASCRSTAPSLPPPIKALADSGLAVRYQPAMSPGTEPQLVLVYASTGTVLASTTSLFTPEVVEAMGAPQESRPVTHMSVSGNTIAAWEDASAHGSAAQIVLFSRDPSPSGSPDWRARRFLAPSERAKPHTIFARPVSVDDEHVYYTLGEGPPEKERLTSLEPIPPGYQPKIEKPAKQEAKGEDDKQSGQSDR